MTGSSRARRIFGGWSANTAQLLLSLTQQIILIPLFLTYWSGDTLSAWLTIYAAGNLVLVGDAGLHGWSLNRFLSFKARQNCDRRTDRYYGAAFRLFAMLTALLVVVLLILFATIPPSRALGFAGQPGFDPAFLIMTLGVTSTLPMNLASSLYRARGRYGRVVGVQVVGTAIGQIGQVAGLMANGSLVAVATAFVAAQIATAVFILFIDLRRQFPFIGHARRPISWRWSGAQLAGAFPFGVMNFAEAGLTYLSVLLIGIFVSDRMAIAQWGLTRTIASLLRGLCTQLTLPLAAELGHDHAIGARESLQGLYARGSVVLVLFVSVVTSATLAFWRDFFEIWTHGAIAYDARLAFVLLLGTCVAAPAILALSYANYSNRGPLLLWTKSLQVVIFLLVSLVLIPVMGPLGAAIALVGSDIIAQLGILFGIVVVETLNRPLRHVALLLALMLTIVPLGAGLGALIGNLLPGSGTVHFLAECGLWLAVVALLAAPLGSRAVRERLSAAIPR
jgi:O-antigen/teichoic acid export membrane protein